MMPTLQSELIRVGLAKEDLYKEELTIQNAPFELREPARRLARLKHKWLLLHSSNRLIYAAMWYAAITIQEKKECFEALCDALEKV